MNLKSHHACRPFVEAGNLSQISAYYEEERNVMWMSCCGRQPRPCFNLELVHDILGLAQAARESGLPIDFWVTGSIIPAIFNVGGDLSFLRRRHPLEQATGVDVVRTRLCRLRACGRARLRHGGDLARDGRGHRARRRFRGSARASLRARAERRAHGLPEIAFNLFPGMGGYSLWRARRACGSPRS